MKYFRDSDTFKFNSEKCTGCGRCIRYCPVSVDISEIVGYLKDPKADPAQWAAEKKDAKN